jgi:hypothetical protein
MGPYSNTGGLEPSAEGTVIVKTITDVVTPGFNSLLKCGGFLPLNPVTIETVIEDRIPSYSGAVHDVYESGCLQDTNRTVNGGYYVDTLWLLTLPPWNDNAINDVVNQALAAARASTYDALTEMAEVQKTISYFRTAVGQLNGVIRSVVQRVLSDAKRRNFISWRARLAWLIDQFSKRWLEYRYAIMPVLYSLEDQIEVLRVGFDRYPDIRGRGYISESINASDTLSTQLNATATLNTTQILQGTYTYRGSAFGYIRSQWNKEVGFDPVITGYEILKFSFVLDWLIDIGSWLQAISPFSNGVAIYGSCASVKEEYTLEQHNQHVWSGTISGRTHSGNSGTSVQKYSVKRYTRFAHGSNFPGFNPSVNAKRVTDLVSLVAQLGKLPTELLKI